MARVASWNSAVLQADTISDINVVLVDRQGVTLWSNETLRYAFGLVVSSIGLADLVAAVRALRRAVIPVCLECPIAMAGDVNLSGAITWVDIIALVNYVFKGGPPASALRGVG